ncbi:SRPBCC domain-containing protein [Paenibacillus sp. N1-5-1-14]|uniref:SRPBCC domain-containing protein n=1 Tax=Paenibacillus radicibacter TaxID=2972488 RepID=UPI0021598A98|nr:SRPBCC domain-containing protein [Paenibacillus radicibacter]MCR8643450.1 SRPBCC domain-containing protein [Paenibacillus radicibacter]
MKSGVLKYEFYINAKPEVVWDTIIKPEGTRHIMFGSVIHSTFEVGAPYQWIGPGVDGDETNHVYGTILEYEPNKLFSCLEHPGPSYLPNHAELESRITMTFEEVGTSTKLTLVNDQFTENHPSYESTEKAWWMILSNVKSYAETGKTMDFGW